MIKSNHIKRRYLSVIKNNEGLLRAITLVYGVWMAIFMRWNQFPYIIPTAQDMLLASAEFIAKFDGILQQSLYANATVYWIWVIFSTNLLFLYAFFIKKILFADKIAKSTTVFCVANLIAVLILMLVLLVTVGKSAFIENLPMWVAYALLFIINFTSLLDKKEVNKTNEKSPTHTRNRLIHHPQEGVL